MRLLQKKQLNLIIAGKNLLLFFSYEQTLLIFFNETFLIRKTNFRKFFENDFFCLIYNVLPSKIVIHTKTKKFVF